MRMNAAGFEHPADDGTTYLNRLEVESIASMI
jgi:hypothetical protein